MSRIEKGYIMKKTIDYILDELIEYNLESLGPLFARFLIEKNKLGLTFMSEVDLDELELSKENIDELVDVGLLELSGDMYVTSDTTEDLLLSAFDKFLIDNPVTKSHTRTKRGTTDQMTESKDFVEEFVSDFLTVKRSFIDRSSYIIVIEKSQYRIKNIEIRHGNIFRLILRRPSKDVLDLFNYASRIKETKDVAYIDFDCSQETIEKVLTQIKGTI